MEAIKSIALQNADGSFTYYPIKDNVAFAAVQDVINGITPVTKVADTATIKGSIIINEQDIFSRTFATENTALTAEDDIDKLPLGTYGTVDFSIFSQIKGDKPFQNPFKLFCFKGGINEPESKQQLAIEWSSEHIAIRHTQNGDTWTAWTVLAADSQIKDIIDGTTPVRKVANTATKGGNEIATVNQLTDGSVTKVANNATKSGSEIATREDTYSKEEVDNIISTVYKYKGSVPTYDALPKSGNKIGDVYNVEDTGLNWAWDGTRWDELGMNINLSLYAKKTDVPGIKVDNAVHADTATSATNATTATNAETATNAGYAGNSAMLGGVAADKYALKAAVSSAQSVFDLIYPVGKVVQQLPGEDSPQTMYNNNLIKSHWEPVTEYDGKFFKIDSKKNVGFFTTEQLPNIKGWIASQRLGEASSANIEGCFSRENYSIAAREQTNLVGNKIKFDSSKTLAPNGSTINNSAYKDPIYENGVYKPVKVQPDNISIKVWERTK